MREYRLPIGILVFFVLVRIIAGLPIDSPTSDAAGPRPHVPDEVLCGFRPEAPESDRAIARAEISATRMHRFLSGAELWKLPPGRTVESAIEQMSTKQSITYIEPNSYGEFTHHQCGDTYCPSEWYVNRISANGPSVNSQAAWHITTGSRNVVVAIPDTGGEFAHPDFGDNIWYNPSEVNGIPSFDDDGNGYVDDVRGYDFGSWDNDPSAVSLHGVSVAGIIGAILGATSGTTTGITGVSPLVSLMTLKTNISGESPTAAAVSQAIDYATAKGAHIINASFAFACPGQLATCQQTLRGSIQNAGDREILVIAGAGNNFRDIDNPIPPQPYLVPVQFNLPNIIGVAGSARILGTCEPPGALQFPCEVKTMDSNWGATSVDLVAPGNDICTTTTAVGGYWPVCCTGDFGANSNCFGGTSAATPMVVGAAALVKSRHMDIPFQILRTHLLDTGKLDPLPGFEGHPTVTGGRLNAYNLVSGDDTTAPTAIIDLRTANRTTSSIDLFWTATGANASAGTATLYQVRFSTSPINASNWLAAKHAVGEPAPASSGSSEVFQVNGLSCNTTYYFALRAFDEWGNGPLSNVVSDRTQTPICPVSFCGTEGSRCFWTGSCGSQGCCVYQCQPDSSCYAPDECPTQACSCPL